MKIMLRLVLSTLVMISSQAFAEQTARQQRPNDPGVNARQDQRTQQGVRSDGRLTREERRDLNQDLNDLSKDIYSEKHGGDKRPRAKP